MKSLVESLFDNNLISKDICIGDVYKPSQWGLFRGREKRGLHPFRDDTSHVGSDWIDMRKLNDDYERKYGDDPGWVTANANCDGLINMFLRMRFPKANEYDNPTSAWSMEFSKKLNPYKENTYGDFDKNVNIRVIQNSPNFLELRIERIHPKAKDRDTIVGFTVYTFKRK